jgi:hypothetical protein
MSFNAPIKMKREENFEESRFCLYEIIAFRFSFKDNSSASILRLYIELIAHPLDVYLG